MMMKIAMVLMFLGLNVLAIRGETNAGSQGGVSSVLSNTSRADAVEEALQGMDVPGLKLVNVRRVWSGSFWAERARSARATYVLRNPPKRGKAGAKGAAGRTSSDLEVEVARFARVGDAQEAVERNLAQRPAGAPAVDKYRGGLLYGQEAGEEDLVCLHGVYVVEVHPVNANASALKMNVLTNVLAKLDSVAEEVSSTSTNVVERILNDVEVQVPDLRVTGHIATPPGASGWAEGRLARASYIFRDNPRRVDPNPGPRVRPGFDLDVEVAQFAGSGEAKKAVEKSLMERSVGFDSEGSFRGGLLYRYGAGPACVICQHGAYVVEIHAMNKDASGLTMRVLGKVLDGIDSGASGVFR